MVAITGTEQRAKLGKLTVEFNAIHLERCLAIYSQQSDASYTKRYPLEGQISALQIGQVTTRFCLAVLIWLPKHDL